MFGSFSGLSAAVTHNLSMSALHTLITSGPAAQQDGWVVVNPTKSLQSPGQGEGPPGHWTKVHI